MSNYEENKTKLNLNAKEYIPKSIQNTYLGNSNYKQNNNNNNIVNNINNNPNNTKSTKHTPLSLNSVVNFNYSKLVPTSKSFYPKNFKPKDNKLEGLKEKQIIEREYFIKYPNENLTNLKFDLDYMLSLENWKISKETKLLTKELLEHIEKFKIFIVESKTTNKKEKNSYKKDKKYNNKEKEEKDFKRNENEDNMKQWGRKDLSKEIELAEKFKEQLEEERKKDPIRFDLTELLNILTVDNYNNISNSIYDIIKDNVENQEKFLDVLFMKAVNEQAFVFLYAKLCKEFDKKLPQKTNKNGKKSTSEMRVKLLDKCKEIFKIEHNKKFDEYITVSDPNEREIKMKKFVLGNVNFIGELINNFVLSKKIVFQCIENLFKRFEKIETDEKLRVINLEAIVVLMDKFGTLLKNSESKMKKEMLDEFNQKINDYIKKLDVVQKESKIPGYVKYKIINLIERKKNNWVESKYQKSIIAKSIEQVRKEHLENQKINSEKNDEEEYYKYNQDEINDKIRIDLNHWKEFIDDGNDKKDYNWEIIEDIYSVHKNSIAEILYSYLQETIDFVQNKNTLQLANEYFIDFIYYYKEISNDEKDEVKNKALHLIRFAYDYYFDNHLIVDIWSNVLFYLINFDIIKYDNFNQLKDCGEEELKCIFKIFNKIIQLDNNTKSNFENLQLIKDNINLYNSIN